MTTNELKKEAEEYALNQWEGNLPWSVIQKAYYDGALPREKRIAELERKLKVETELSNRLGVAYREYEELTKEQDEHLAKLEKENTDLKEALKGKVCKCMIYFNFKDLEKENAELKKEVSEVRQHLDLTEREWGKDTTKLIHFKTQLAKAKDHIKRLLGCLQQDTNDPQTNYYVVQYMTEAEQFLKENA